MWPIANFWDSKHMTGTAEPKVVKFCTQVGYINCSNRMTYHTQWQKGCGYGHVTVFYILPLPWWCRSSHERQLSYLLVGPLQSPLCCWPAYRLISAVGTHAGNEAKYAEQRKRRQRQREMFLCAETINNVAPYRNVCHQDIYHSIQALAIVSATGDPP